MLPLLLVLAGPLLAWRSWQTCATIRLFTERCCHHPAASAGLEWRNAGSLGNKQVGPRRSASARCQHVQRHAGYGGAIQSSLLPCGAALACAAALAGSARPALWLACPPAPVPPLSSAALQNVFDDFQACAQYLHQHKYASPETTVIQVGAGRAGPGFATDCRQGRVGWGGAGWPCLAATAPAQVSWLGSLHAAARERCP